MTIADRIKQKREELGLSQEDLAKKCGYADKTSISKIENSGNDITLKKINKIADALNVSHRYLMGWEDEDGDLTVLGQLGYSYEKQELLKTLSNYSSDQLAEFVKFLNLFTKATHEVQSAIETLLKSQ